MDESSNGGVDLQVEDGPAGWRIWRAMLAGAPYVDGWESLLYADARVVGDATDGLGPFELLSTVAEPLNSALAPRIALRVWWRDPGQAPKVSKTKIKKQGSSWLALDIDAEIASLVSLILGGRIRSGGKVRRFSTEDPGGRPMYAEHSVPLALVPAYRTPIMPGLTGVQASLAAVTNLLARYPYLKAQQAVALVRAARHYANALWVADSDPEQAWLQLVSAVETTAAQWKTTTVDPAIIFADHFPQPAQIISQLDHGEELLTSIAPYFVSLIGATRRFEDFIETFKPDPPYPRPPVGTNTSPRVDWSNLRPVVKTIYQHRSALLHNGTPFPADLCVPPLMIDNVPEEKPLGYSSSVGNVTWSARETPIRLHTFAHLTRGAILNWWAAVTKPT
jgi:hypothetical protein